MALAVGIAKPFCQLVESICDGEVPTRRLSKQFGVLRYPEWSGLGDFVDIMDITAQWPASERYLIDISVRPASAEICLSACTILVFPWRCCCERGATEICSLRIGCLPCCLWARKTAWPCRSDDTCALGGQSAGPWEGHTRICKSYAPRVCFLRTELETSLVAHGARRTLRRWS